GVDNLLDMPKENVTKLGSLTQTYHVCTCENHNTGNSNGATTVSNKATCSTGKTVNCNIFKTKKVETTNACFVRRE
ncbi:hypothetical protein MHBO_003595, partial [Bonamia ostreae]